MEVVRYFCACVLFYCMVLLQVPNVNSSFEIVKTNLPFCIDLPTTLRPGQVFKIKGFAGTNQTRLNLNLKPGCEDSKRIFHVTIKFNDKVMIRNVYYDGNWKEEERSGPFPFSRGQKFELLIEVQADGYKGIGNNVPLWTYAHRLPYKDALILEANGENMVVMEIVFIDVSAEKEEERIQTIYPVSLEEPNRNPTVPFLGRFPVELEVGDVISITGRPTSSESRFDINLCDDCFNGPILFHLDVRFSYLTDRETIVRNAFIGRWMSEERSRQFPFRERQTFNLIFEVQRNNYMVTVDGVNYWNFTHRLPFVRVKQILVEGLVQLFEVELIEKRRSNVITSEMLTHAKAICQSSSSCLTTSYLIVGLAFLTTRF